MLSAAYADLVEETGERLCHVTTEQDEPALPLSSASLDVGCDRLVVGDARGVVWTWDGGVASSRGCDLGELGRFGGLRRYEALFALVGSREAPRRSGSGRPWACVRAVRGSASGEVVLVSGARRDVCVAALGPVGDGPALGPRGAYARGAPVRVVCRHAFGITCASEANTVAVATGDRGGSLRVVALGFALGARLGSKPARPATPATA